MDNNDPNFGRETGHDPQAFWTSTGHRLWDRVMQQYGMQYNNIGWADMEADNSSVIMSNFVRSANNNPPMRLDNSAPYDPDTVAKAFATGISMLKRKYSNQMNAAPGGDYFPEEEQRQCRRQLKRNHARNLMEDPEETELFKSIYPLPRKHSNGTLIFRLQQIPIPELNSVARNWDLLAVASALFSQGKFGKLLEVLLTNNCIGRGGEAKFLNYKTMFQDSIYNLLFSLFFQKKTLKSNPTGMVPDFEHYQLCVYFIFGCYWACEDGLARDEIGLPNSPQRRKSYFVFQELHGIRDSSVSQRITGTIRSVLPNDIREYYSGKSLRYGAMTRLTWDPAVTYEEAIALGGWRTNCNRDWYVWQYLVALVPPVLTLAGYPDCRVIPHLPSLGMLFFHDSLEDSQRLDNARFQRFIRKLYILDLPEFKEQNSPQRNFLVVVTAVMVMHFGDAYLKLGSQHSYCRKIINAAMDSQIPYADTQARAIQLLQKYSSIVKSDFKKGNIPPTEGGDQVGRRSVPEQIAKMNDSVSKLLSFKTHQQAQLQQLHERMDETTEELARVKTRVQTVTELLDCIVTQNRNIQLRLNQLMSHQGVPVEPLPDTPQAVRRSQLVANAVGRHLDRQNGAAAAPEPQVAQVAIAEAPVEAPVPPPAPPVPPVEPARRERISVNQALNRHRRTPPGNRGATRPEHKLEKCLMAMYRAPNNHVLGAMVNYGKLCDRTTWLTQQFFPSADRQAPGKIMKVLDLVDAVLTREDRQKFLRHQMSDSEANRFVNRTVKQCKEIAWTMLKLRQIDDAKNFASRKAACPKHYKAGPRVSSQILGMSNNIGTFELEQYVPDYDVAGHPRRSRKSLCEHYDDTMLPRLSALVAQYHHNGYN